MSKGFTLIELMISITILTLTIGGGMVYLNNFNASQKIQTTKSNLISILKQARSFANTSQLPKNPGSDPLRCVMVTIDNSGLATIKTEYGSVYLTKQVADSNVTITLTNQSNYVNVVPCFAYYSGKLLVPGSNPNVYDTLTSGTAFYYSIQTAELGAGTTDIVSVNQSGTINEKL